MKCTLTWHDFEGDVALSGPDLIDRGADVIS